MVKNVGGYERIGRLVVGALLVLVGVGGYAGLVPLAWTGIGQALTGIVAVVIGLVLLVTGYVQWCPLSGLLGISTYRGPTAGEDEEAPLESSA